MRAEPAAPVDGPGRLLARFRSVRARTDALTAGLSEADATPQSMPDASPAKWHLAHTAWFFETFVAAPHAPGYRRFDARFGRLFNSYYDSVGERAPRSERGLITRPGLSEVRAYRAHVDQAIAAAWDGLPVEALALIELGLAHEEQHQELILTDLLHLFSRNPCLPAWFPTAAWEAGREAPMGWIEQPGGLVEIGHARDGFAFDCEGPRHQVWLRPYAIADRLVTNGEWLGFVEAGGYRDPLLWLSDGWAWVQRESVEAPLYWRRDGERGWLRFGFAGEVRLDPAAPVAHVSHYEADAYARWAGARLPTEAEWEAVAADCDPAHGNQLDGPGAIGPRAAPEPDGGLRQMFGDCWQWTASAYLPHPGFRPSAGAVGEYNGKFMSGQMVLKGASACTPRGHPRPSYRNFFPPAARWQMTGVRLARDV